MNSQIAQWSQVKLNEHLKAVKFTELVMFEFYDNEQLGLNGNIQQWANTIYQACISGCQPLGMYLDWYDHGQDFYMKEVNGSYEFTGTITTDEQFEEIYKKIFTKAYAQVYA